MSGDAEGERAGEVGEDAEQAGEGVGDVEDLLLAFLEVLVVGEGQAFDEGGERGGGAEQAGGFAAGELGEVGVLLLRHGGAAGGEGFGEVDEAELGGGVEGELFGEARDVEAEGGGGLREVEHEVAVGGGVHAVGGGGGEAEGVGGDGAVEREGGAGDGSAAERAEVHAGAGVGEAGEVALEHGDVGEEPVRDEDGFGALEVGVAGHDVASPLASARVRRASSPVREAAEWWRRWRRGRRGACRWRSARCGCGRCGA